ncbi:MAG: DUF805 domain-containing protein, partial [Alphaproteobacteria bacterium]|nr:DUF805 domain-containing protein [Alphaproteobacteria bacterium]
KKTVKKSGQKSVKKITSKPTVQKIIVKPVTQVRPNVKSKEKIGIFGAIANFWKGYFNFSGRSTRSEFWFGILFAFVFVWLSALICTQFWFGGYVCQHLGICADFSDIYWIQSIVVASLIIPLLSLGLRRYRDAGISSLVFFVPSIVVFGMPLIRTLKWQQNLMIDYVSPDMHIYGIFVLVFMITNIVVGCLPSKK